ncbi:MAG TPA: ATP-dependent DNA helicase [Acetobacteraceae bacterium]|nr:ATP-dependent DNA helicase [Acetobacteraceae bacterium]
MNLSARIATPACPGLLLPEGPALVAAPGRAALLDADGVLHSLSAEEAAHRLRRLPPPLLVHAPATFRRLGMPRLPCYDLLDLFAFVLPAHPAAPSPRGLAQALGEATPKRGLEAEAAFLPRLAEILLKRLAAARAMPRNESAAGLAALMGRAGWSWAPFVVAALDRPAEPPSPDGLRVWRRLPEWEERVPPPPPASHPVPAAEARARLAGMLGAGAEPRPGQSDYAAAATGAFAPREAAGSPQIVLAEAGTGTGKTLGYIAAASLWAERNRGPVWISTFTRHLQRQVEAELARLYPEPALRRRRVVVRKGRENFLCLLNLEDTVTAALGRETTSLIPLGLVARWAGATADGDLLGGDLPGWLAELFGPATVLGLADRRGECIHAACAHWRRCFVEHTIRRAREADLVVANHALVMVQAAWGGLDDASVPLRYVFDEGHHLFDAADSAFAFELSGATMAELRRWLLGAEGSRSRARGLALRIEDLLGEKSALREALDQTLAFARALPAPGWQGRLAEPDAPRLFAANPAENLLREVRTQVRARAADDADAPEADLHPVAPPLVAAGKSLARALARLEHPLKVLAQGLATRLREEAETLEQTIRLRIEAAVRNLGRRALGPLTAWQDMLRQLEAPPPLPEEKPEQVHFLRLDRRDGRESDAALLRYWLDPTQPFAATLGSAAHGLLVTSATLRDAGRADAEAAWRAAEARTGAAHLPGPPTRVSVLSPFDYANQTRAFIVTDVSIGDISGLAAAYRALFLAAGGGALGLFTAIRRLRAVHPHLATALEEMGIPLYAQHVDAMDNATLVDIFRTEEESCLLGTDAMRDGVDVPGRALRLVVFDKVPWARPDILHRERRRHLSDGEPGAYDDRIARLRLRQAFGRLIRAATDRGAFVLLDRRMPSRLLSAFPEGVVVRRVGLAEAVSEVRAFIAKDP